MTHSALGFEEKALPHVNFVPLIVKDLSVSRLSIWAARPLDLGGRMAGNASPAVGFYRYTKKATPLLSER